MLSEKRLARGIGAFSLINYVSMLDKHDIKINGQNCSKVNQVLIKNTTSR